MILDWHLAPPLSNKRIADAARRLHEQMTDKDRFTVAEVYTALTLSLPLSFDRMLDDIPEWGRSPDEREPFLADCLKRVKARNLWTAR